MEQDKFVQRIKRLSAKGVSVPAAMNYLKDAEIEAIRKILIKKGLTTEKEYYNLADEIQEEWTKKFEEMLPLPK